MKEVGMVALLMLLVAVIVCFAVGMGTCMHNTDLDNQSVSTCSPYQAADHFTKDRINYAVCRAPDGGMDIKPIIGNQ